jgi:hypothetical protein
MIIDNLSVASIFIAIAVFTSLLLMYKKRIDKKKQTNR